MNESVRKVIVVNYLGTCESELIDGAEVMVCNSCDEGFNLKDGIEKHLTEVQNKFVGPNK